MPSTWELTSAKTGQVYKALFDADEPDDVDLQSAIDQFDDDFYREQGLDPSIAEQGPVGTVANKVLDVGPGLVGGLMSNAGRVLDAASEGVARLTGTERGGLFADVAEVGDRIQEAGKELRPTNPANQTANTIGSSLQQTAGLVGSMFMAAPFVGAKTAMTTVPLAIGGVMGAGEGVQTARDLGIDNPAGQLATGAAFAGAEVLTEKLGGVGNKAVTDAVQRGVARTIKDAGKTVFSEFIEEPVAGAVQEGITRIAGETVADPDRPGFTISGAALPTMEGFWDRRLQEAIGGAVGGTVFGGLQLAASRGAPAGEVSTSAESAMPEEPAPLAEGEVPMKLVHPVSGRTFDVAFAGTPTEEDINNATEWFNQEDDQGELNTAPWAGPVPPATPPRERASAEVQREFQQRAVLRPAAPLPGLEEHVSDLTVKDVADIEAANRFANPQDPSLSPVMQPGNLAPDVSRPTAYTDAEAADLVQRWGRTLPASLRAAGRVPAPAAADVLRARAESLGFAEAFAGLFGRRVVVFDGLGETGPGGATHPDFKGTVFLNARSPRHWHSLAGHEMVHHLEVAHPDLYRRLDNVLRGQITRMDVARENYKAYHEQGGDTNVRRELYGDLMAESMSDPQFWDRMGQAEPGLFMPLARSVWQWFKEVLDGLKRQGWEASQYFREVRRAQNALAAAMVEFARREQGLTPSQAARAVGDVLSGDNMFEGLRQADEIAGPPELRETQSRFARPDEVERLYGVRKDATVAGQAEGWLNGRSLETALDQLSRPDLPEGITSEDVKQQAIGQALMRATAAMQTGDEFARTQARVLAHRAARLYQDAGRESARALRQRGVVNHLLVPMAPVLAAESLLIDRADVTLNQRFDGGAKGAAGKADAAAKKSGQEAGQEMAEDLEAETTPDAPMDNPVTKATRARRREQARQKHPNLARMLNELRKKMYPGMKWQEIFEELPSQQRERQRQIYTRLRKDQRLRNLTPEETLKLTNELDKAWQRERRKVFQRELRKVGAMGEKDTPDRQKVEKAMPKLLRAINLGLMNSETFREAVAPEYGLKMLTSAQAAELRQRAEEAYAQPQGLLQNRKLAELLIRIQETTGVSRAELLNSYWVAAVLSGLRTMFDTFMSVGNGLLTSAIQSAMLGIYNRKPKAAVEAMQQWFWGLKQSFRESGQILAKGDYSYQKRFNDDLRKALEGETSYRPVPLGEALWASKDSAWWEKWGVAPVMMWTGRLMAAADHINNTATTAGAQAVARALHPEIYQGASSFSGVEKDAAMAQAKREILGDEKAAPTKAQFIDLQARQREILAGLLRPEERQEASFIGDQAAYQNDPTGVMGTIYEGMNVGFGQIERVMEKSAELKRNQAAKGLMLFLSGALRSVLGAKFIRFGANFGNDNVSYIPGTYLVSSAILGDEATRSQQQLMLGKNIFGFMLALGVAAYFLGKDDEEDGWHSEGGWNDLTPDEVKALIATGRERHSFWRVKDGQTQTVSYKQWPTAGIIAAVAHMQDRRRFAPEKWEKEGMAGHLLAAASVGLLQVKEAAAVRGLAELMGGSKFGANPEDDFVDKLRKLPTNFAGGFIPTLAKDVDLLNDPSRYKPEGIYEELIRNVPLLRRTVNDGRPELNILGVPIQQDRKPWSRTYTQSEHGPAHAALANLMARGYRLPVPSTKKRIFAKGAWTTVEQLGGEAEWKYQKYVGEGYAAFLIREAQTLRKLEGKPLESFIQSVTESIKDTAAYRVADQL